MGVCSATGGLAGAPLAAKFQTTIGARTQAEGASMTTEVPGAKAAVPPTFLSGVVW